MPGGRPRKPDAQKRHDGDRKDRINGDAPRPPEGLPEPPDHLDELGRAAFLRVGQHLHGMQVLSLADGEALALYAQNYSLWRRASAQVDREGLLVATGTGSVKPHPLLAVANEAQRAMARILAQCGLTPAARSALRVVASEGSDDLAHYENDL